MADKGEKVLNYSDLSEEDIAKISNQGSRGFTEVYYWIVRINFNHLMGDTLILPEAEYNRLMIFLGRSLSVSSSDEVPETPPVDPQ